MERIAHGKEVIAALKAVAALPARDAAPWLDEETEGEEEAPPPGALAGCVWRLARDRQGSRVVQRSLEAAAGDEARERLALELRGHVWHAMQCPHANYVLQRCIESMPHRACQFILDEIARKGSAGVGKAARHPYACRVLQRLLEHFPAEKLRGLVEDLLADGAALSMHRFGTYVMQHILEHGAPAQRQTLTGQLALRAKDLGQNPYSCMVLSKALLFAEPQARCLLARALLREPGLVPSMAQTRHGHAAVEQLLLGVGDRWDHLEARRQLSEEAPSLRVTRHGRSVLKCLEANRQPSAGTPGLLGGA